MAHIPENKNFEEMMLALESHDVTSEPRGRNSNSPSTEPAVVRERKKKSEINQKSSTQFQGNKTVNQPADRNPPEKKISDIRNVSLKTRIIHLLALASHTKLELFNRIEREGVNRLERLVVLLILKEVSFVIEDSYYLRSCFWDDVKEDWPYYSEEEKAKIKKRKTSSLISPDSDDGSSGSRSNSPNSVTAGSPSMIMASSPLELTYKPSYENNDGPPTKRQRTSD